MVIKVIMTIIENNSLEMCPNITPKVPTIKENSPILDIMMALKKAGFLVYLNTEQRTIISKGLKKMAKQVKMMMGRNIFLTTAKETPSPKETKNNKAKKSRKDLTLPIISNR